MALFGRHSRRARVISSAARPLVEPMEQRTLLSASLVGGGMLLVGGTHGPDVITVSLNADDATKLDVTVNDTTTQFDLSSVRRIRINGKNGGDALTLDETNGAISLPATLVGGNGGDTLVGASGDDVLQGGNGDDVLTGNAGRDLLDGANGNDSCSGGDGDDLLRGGAGDDSLDGGTGNDLLDGQNGRDHLHGRAGKDLLRGGGGSDSLSGGGGSDDVDGGTAVDQFDNHDKATETHDRHADQQHAGHHLGGATHDNGDDDANPNTTGDDQHDGTGTDDQGGADDSSDHDLLDDLASGHHGSDDGATLHT